MNGMILTDAGRNLLALALTGRPLLFSRAEAGDGVLGSADAAKLTALISPKRELPIQSMNTLQGIGTCEVVVEMSNKGLSSGFFVREYGLYAKHPDTNADILYAYCNKGNESGYLEGDNGVDQIQYTLSLVTVIDQAPNVTAYITNTNQYVTISRMEQRVLDLFAPYTNPAGFWTFTDAEDQRMRPSSLEQTRELILQGADVHGFDGRLERVEDALAQTMLMLETMKDFPGWTHFMAEDFKDTSMLDTFSAKVLSVVAGDDSLDVNPIGGMLPGSFYTLTDGVSTETVRAESINLENGVQRVILAEPVKNTYLLANAIIYRTSANLNSQSAAGPGTRLSYEWTPSLVWKGTGASEEFTVPVDMSVKNSAAYDVSGSGVYDDTGSAALRGGN